MEYDKMLFIFSFMRNFRNTEKLDTFQLEHINRRDKITDNKILDELNASIQRANLILSEFVMGHDAKHIVSFLVKMSSLKFERLLIFFRFILRKTELLTSGSTD